MIYIKNDIESVYTALERLLEDTNPIILEHNRELIFKVVVENHKAQFIRRQHRINSLMSPIRIVRELLQEIIGENVEKVQLEEVINLTPIKEDINNTRKILNNL